LPAHICDSYARRSLCAVAIWGGILLIGSKIPPSNICGRNLNWLTEISLPRKILPPPLHNFGLRHQVTLKRPVLQTWLFHYELSPVNKLDSLSKKQTKKGNSHRRVGQPRKKEKGRTVLKFLGRKWLIGCPPPAQAERWNSHFAGPNFDWLIYFILSLEQPKLPNAEHQHHLRIPQLSLFTTLNKSTLTSSNDPDKSTLTSPRVLHTFSSTICMGKKGKTEVGTDIGEGVKKESHTNMAICVWDSF